MLYSNSFQGKKPLRFWARGIAILTILFCITAPLFMGCPMEGDGPGDSGTTLIGAWYSPAGDGYEINGIQVIYYGMDSASSGKFSYTGIIQNPKPDFTKTAGVIIVKYADTDTPNPNTEAGLIAPTGSYQGIYWKSLSGGTVELANAFNGGNTADTEKSTLTAAQDAFILDNAGTYAAYYGAHARQAANYYTKTSRWGFLRALWTEPENVSELDLIYNIARDDTLSVYAGGYMADNTLMFSARIVAVTGISQDSGTILLKVTKTKSPFGAGDNGFTTGTVNVGEWYAVSWKNKQSGDKEVELCWAEQSISAATAQATAFLTFQTNASNEYFGGDTTEYFTFKKY